MEWTRRGPLWSSSAELAPNLSLDARLLFSVSAACSLPGPLSASLVHSLFLAPHAVQSIACTTTSLLRAMFHDFPTPSSCSVWTSWLRQIDPVPIVVFELTPTTEFTITHIGGEHIRASHLSR
jgi:hypothetical protein